MLRKTRPVGECRQDFFSGQLESIFQPEPHCSRSECQAAAVLEYGVGRNWCGQSKIHDGGIADVTDDMFALPPDHLHTFQLRQYAQAGVDYQRLCGLLKLLSPAIELDDADVRLAKSLLGPLINLQSLNNEPRHLMAWLACSIYPD